MIKARPEALVASLLLLVSSFQSQANAGSAAADARDPRGTDQGVMVVQLPQQRSATTPAAKGSAARVAILGAPRQREMAARLPQLDARVAAVETSRLDLAEVWKALAGAKGALLLVDATEGPTQRIRDHVLLARQAGYERLPIVFWFVGDLLEIDDGRSLFAMEVEELQRVHELYLGKPVWMRSDVAVATTAALGGRDVEHILAPPRTAGPAAPRPMTELAGTTYVLAEGEGARATTLAPESKVRLLLVDGEVVDAVVDEGRLGPAENGPMAFRFSPRPVRMGSRFAVLEGGSLVAVGFVDGSGVP